jgi:hypothetical protein
MILKSVQYLTIRREFDRENQQANGNSSFTSTDTFAYQTSNRTSGIKDLSVQLERWRGRRMERSQVKVD